MKRKTIEIVEELKKKYKAPLAKASRALKNDYVDGRLKEGAEPLFSTPFEPNIFLFQKWAYRVGKGWYGFALDDIPRVWVRILNDFLAWVELQCPDFEIHQIKSKFGGVYVHIETHCKNEGVNQLVRSEISKLQALMFHKKLIYSGLISPLKSSKRGPSQPG